MNDLNLLPALRALLEQRNVSRAATRLGLSQPAASRLFARLKQEFADPLMVRSGNQYQLTPQGNRLLQQLNQLLPQLDSLWQNAPLKLAEVTQTVTLAGTDMDVVLISANLSRLLQRAPNLTVQVRSSTPRVFDDLGNGEIDLALSAFDDQRAGLYRKLICDEQFVAIAAQHSEFDANQFTLEHYLGARHGKFGFVETTHGRVDVALQSLGLHREISLSLPTFLQIPAFLDDPRIIFSVPQRFADYLSQHYPLKLLPLPFAVKSLPIYLYWHERLHHSPLHRWLREQLFNTD